MLKNIAFVVAACGSACGSSSTTTPDAAAVSGPTACAAVGTAYCHQVYACYSATQLSDMQYPATEAECVTQENANCAQLEPGYCKSSTQTSAANAELCAMDLSGLTCAQFTGTPSPTDACKTKLCNQ